MPETKNISSEESEEVQLHESLDSFDAICNIGFPHLIERARRAGILQPTSNGEESCRVAFKNRSASVSISRGKSEKEIYRLTILSDKGIPVPNKEEEAFVFEVYRISDGGVGKTYGYSVSGLKPNQEVFQGMGAAEITRGNLGNNRSIKIAESLLSHIVSAFKAAVDKIPIEHEPELVLPSANEVSKVAGSPIIITGGFAGGDLQLIRDNISRATGQNMAHEAVPDVLDFIKLLQFYLSDSRSIMYHLSQMAKSDIGQFFHASVACTIEEKLRLMLRIRGDDFETGYPKRPRRARVSVVHVSNEAKIINVTLLQKWLQINGRDVDKIVYSFRKIGEWGNSYSATAFTDGGKQVEPLLSAEYNSECNLAGNDARPEMLKVAALVLLLRDGLINEWRLTPSSPRPLRAI